MSGRGVHAVVVAYHAAEQLDRALGGIAGHVPVTVVDNSASIEVAAVSRRHGAAYVETGANLGFAGGVNAALALLEDNRADVLLVNPDAVVTPTAIDELESFLCLPENARVAAVAPRLIGADGGDQRVLWPYPSPTRMWAEAVGLGRLPARRRFAVGAVLLLARDAVNDVGRFDERFFLYAEETDWQRRASRRGWRSEVRIEATARHEGSGTSPDARRREALFHAAQETYIRKWYGAAGWWCYRAAAFAGAAGRMLVLSGTRRREAARRALIYLKGPRRCAPGP